MARPDSCPALTRPGSLDLPAPTAPGSRLELLVGAGEVIVTRDPAARRVRVELRELRGGRLTGRAAGGSVLVALEGTGSPHAALRVTAPPDAALTVRTRSASVLVMAALSAGTRRTGPAAPVEVHTADGAVEFRRTGGAVTFRTEAGAVTATGATGRLTGRTDTGGVHLDLSPAPGAPAAERGVEVTTGAGSIAVRVAPDADARVRASSGTGRVVTDVPGLSCAAGAATGTVGGGAARWTLNSASGGVALLRQGPDAPTGGARGGVR
ncbi:hypothetical protein [Streptomyces bohaiensis]|uniref:Adhesin domain-containing protein n=1 Tax=Streptomyces bohaiensis TaxID=1431344 RepID=A0ABX1C6L0_9ACTN|nr:hypothetical protein [Streptomyces bohaiensis]NJQ14821.1 hypothetical protein [Streptomyces bohaiensis]